MTTSPRRIVFLGTHGQYNIGDELLLETFLEQLGPDHHYVVNSYDPDYTRAQLAGRFTVEVIDTAGDRRRLPRELWLSDLVVFGGGSIVKELYASTGRNRYATLVMILAVVTFARRIARKPVAMLNIGVGPLHTSRGLRLARMILSQVDVVTVRDERSWETCRQLGVEATLATDAVFSADRDSLLGSGPGPDDAVEGVPHSDMRRPVRIALNLNYDIENPANWEGFLRQLALSLEDVHARCPVELHSLPMQTGFKEVDDVKVIADFAERVPSIPFVRHELTSPGQVARLVTSCEIVLAERLHAVVMASILGVPSFVLAYDVKVRELAKILGIEQWSVDINQPFDPHDVSARLLHLIEDRAAVAGHVSARSGELRGQARAGFERARQWAAGDGRA